MHDQRMESAQELLPVGMRLPVQPEDEGSSSNATLASSDAAQTGLIARPFEKPY